MTYDAIRTFFAARVVVIALPAHTSDRLQPLDVCVFGPWKHYSNQKVRELAEHGAHNTEALATLKGYDVVKAIIDGYDKSFNVANIVDGFNVSGLPLNLKVPVGLAIRKSSVDDSLVRSSIIEDDKNKLLLSYF